MLVNRNILCVGTPPWESNYASTTVELMKMFGSQNRVLYVNSGYTIKDIFLAIVKRQKIPLLTVLGLKKRTRTIFKTDDGEITLLTLPMQLTINFLPPGLFYRLGMRFNGWLARQCIRRHLKRLGMAKDLVHINSFSPALGLTTAGRLNEALTIYHCYDEIGAAPWMSKHGPWLEQAFAAKVDGIIVTSRGLLETKQHLNPHCYLVKNAANVELFSKGFSPVLTENKSIGFIGSLDERVDYDLIQYVAENLPEMNFTFIGRTTNPPGIGKLTGLPNTTFVAPKPLEELPQFVRHFSAGIIPFKKDRFTKGIYPLKINEYLAAGLPVITTDFSYLDDFENVVEIAPDKETFRDAILRSVTGDSIEKKRLRQQHAKDNSWHKRIEEFSDIINNLENKKKASPEVKIKDNE